MQSLFDALLFIYIHVQYMYYIHDVAAQLYTVVVLRYLASALLQLQKVTSLPSQTRVMRYIIYMCTCTVHCTVVLSYSCSVLCPSTIHVLTNTLYYCALSTVRTCNCTVVVVQLYISFNKKQINGRFDRSAF